MVTVLELLLLISLFAGSVIRSKCESQPASSMKCLMNLDQARQVLGTTIPPINDSRMTDNYYNISRALYPSISLPALYVKVTIQFLHDYQNGTKRIDDKKEKFTWSKACSYVSVKNIGLDAMSVFSLATIFPQRRASQLVFTVPPFCKNSPYAQNEEMVKTSWRYIVSTLEDIVSSPKLSDPRLNSAGCVVIGHEGNIDEYPELWFFYWFILTASFFSSVSIWIILRYSLIGAKDQYKNICRSLLRMASVVAFFDTLVCIIVVPVLTSLNKTASLEIFAYVIAYGILLVITFLLGCLWNWKYIGCKVAGDCIIRAGSYLLWPFLFQTAHHFLWVVCGMISEPFWAIPIFLLECLFFASTLYSIFLYEKEFGGNSKSGDTTSSPWQPGENELTNGCIKAHLLCCWLSFVLILVTVALIAVGNGNAVNSPTAGAIEGAITVIFFWLARNSDLNFWFKHKDKTETAEELQSLNRGDSNR